MYGVLKLNAKQTQQSFRGKIIIQMSINGNNLPVKYCGVVLSSYNADQYFINVVRNKENQVK